jgi:Asp-tRNA(Asn)/Glu-tRNA(Gln) amidotransferase A subunit family amidase
MKGDDDDDDDDREPNVTGTITIIPRSPSSPSERMKKGNSNQSTDNRKERKTAKPFSSHQISIAVSACVLVLAVLFDQIGKKRRKNRLKSGQKMKVKDCGAFVEIVDIPCPPPPEKHVVRKLANLKFVLKDIFEVKGRRDKNDSSCGFGSPKWKEFMKEKKNFSNSNDDDANKLKNAAIVDMLLKNGASLVGITHMDELAYSIDGQNEHYGTPINPAADNRLPGGSSSGSAVAVASRLRDCDFGIGTDSAGSVRVPAAYCGVFGFRPSHGMVSTAGCQEFAKTFDTVGWFAKGSKVLKDVGDVLLKPADDEKYGINEPKQFAILTDLMKLADPQGSAAVASALKAFGYDDKYAGKVSKLDLGERLKMLSPSLRTDTTGRTGLELIRDKMHATMGFEIHEALKEFLAFLEKQDGATPASMSKKDASSLGKFTAQRIENAKKITEQDYENLMKVRGEIREVMDQIMDNGTVLIFPTVPGIAPMREGRSDEEVQAWRMKTFQFLAIASFCGLPQVTIPLRYPNAEGPHSVSLLGGFQTDKMLLECAFKYSAQMQEYFPNYVITEMMKSNPAMNVPGDEEKVKGNKAFAEGKYEEAISWYNKALEKKKLPVYYANRSLVYLKMGKMEEVEKDCTKALEMDSKYVKAYLRRGKARMILGSFLEAAMDYEEALRLEPTNREARNEMANMQKHLESGAMDASMPNDDLEIVRSFI